MRTTKVITLTALQHNIGTSHLAYNLALHLAINLKKRVLLIQSLSAAPSTYDLLHEVYEFPLPVEVPDPASRDNMGAWRRAATFPLSKLVEYIANRAKQGRAGSSLVLPFIQSHAGTTLAFLRYYNRQSSTDLTAAIVSAEQAPGVYDYIIVDDDAEFYFKSTTNHQNVLLFSQNVYMQDRLLPYLSEIQSGRTLAVISRYVDEVFSDYESINKYLSMKAQSRVAITTYITDAPELFIGSEGNGTPLILNPSKDKRLAKQITSYTNSIKILGDVLSQLK